MPIQSKTKTVPINATWGDSSSGYYFWYTAKVDIWGIINDARNSVTYYCSDPYDAQSDEGTLFGAGFVDCIGYFWDPGASSGQSNRIANVQPESLKSGIAGFQAGLRNIGYCSQSSDPLLWCIGGVAQRNDTKEMWEFGGSSHTYTKNGDFSDLSVLNNIPVIGIGTRWRDNNSNEAVVDMRSTTITFEWESIPWSVYYPDSRDGGKLKNFSCNRRVTDGSGTTGGLWMYDSTSDYHGVTTDTAWNNYNGDWQNSITFGELA